MDDAASGAALHTVMASCNCQFDTTWKRVSMKDYLHWAGLWACLWGVDLKALIWEGPAHCGQRHSLGRAVLNCRGEDTGS